MDKQWHQNDLLKESILLKGTSTERLVNSLYSESDLLRNALSAMDVPDPVPPRSQPVFHNYDSQLYERLEKFNTLDPSARTMDNDLLVESDSRNMAHRANLDWHAESSSLQYEIQRAQAGLAITEAHAGKRGQVKAQKQVKLTFADGLVDSDYSTSMFHKKSAYSTRSEFQLQLDALRSSP